jgi:hypothetical protein
MAKQTINIGTIPNDGTGDTLRNAMDKINDNTDELYAVAVEPTAFYFTGQDFRIVVRGGKLCIDEAITALGFGVGALENTDWGNIIEFKLP